MRKIKIIFLTIVLSLTFSLNVNSRPVPASFADLAEKLMPSVVDILTSQTVVTKSNPFPGFEFVTTVCVVEILTTDGINFSARSANEDGTSLECN